VRIETATTASLGGTELSFVPPPVPVEKPRKLSLLPVVARAEACS
jgi:hypothetical protein